MSIPGSAHPLLLGAAGQETGETGGYEIERSLRFNSADSAYLSRTPASAGNRKTWTWAGWMKRATVTAGDLDCFFACVVSASDYVQIAFQPGSNYLGLYIANPSGTAQSFSASAYRDLSAWYHIVISFDSTQATPSNRLKVFVNGTEITYSTDARSSIVQNTDFAVNSTNQHVISSYLPYASGRYFNGYLADVIFVDGQALTPSSFTEVSATTGQLIPKAYTGTYGTNGFHLPFSDNSTGAALGTDTSGNSNTWTVNNISVAAGAGNDSLVDTPTSYGDDDGLGGSVRGNYCTLNPLWNNGHILSNGNLDYAPPSPKAWRSVLSTFGMPSGKWYWEQTYISGSANCMAGFGNASSTLISYPASPNSTGYDFVDGNIYGAGAGVSAGATLSAGDIMGISVDVDAGEAKFYKNGVLQTTLSHGIVGTLFPLVSSYDGVGCVNFGQRPFAYTAPSGFKALCTANLPEGSITTSGTFTGNSSTDGPFVYLNGVPTAMTINGNAVTFGTHADKLSNGFKVRNSTSSYNASGSNTYSISSTDAKFKVARAQANP